MDKNVFTNQIHGYISLLSSYFNNKETPFSNLSTDELSFFYKVSKHHSLRALFFLAIRDTKTNVSVDGFKKLEDYYLLTLRRDVLFEIERKALYSFLDENGIDYLPLKGIIIRDLYPDAHSREYADNDILFFGDDETVKRFFEERDYLVKTYRQYHHDVYVKAPFYNFEMHRTLFGENGDSAKLIKYYNGIFGRTIAKNRHERFLSNDDFYVYFTAHSYKHYHVSGFGIRTLIDYYLYLKKTKLDFNYINKELKKLGLLDFSNKISTLSLKLFDNEPLNEDEEEMFLFIASSGTYGTLGNRVERGIKEKGKFRYFMSRVFPPYSYYKLPYPWAYYCPILIPIAWVISFVKRVFRNPKRASSELKMINKQKQK